MPAGESQWAFFSFASGWHALAGYIVFIASIIKAVAEQCFDKDGNHYKYSNAPKLSDLEVVALVCCAEALEIDSENLLYSKLNSYPEFLVHRCSCQRYNARCPNLIDLIDLCLRKASVWIDEYSEALLTDSMPIPTASIKRERRSRACRRPEFDVQCADKTYHSSSGSFMLGFKLHLITTVSDVYVNHFIRPASHHDAKVFSELAEAAMDGALPNDLHARLESRLLLADKGYIGKQLRLDYATEFKGELKSVFRSNSID